MQLNAKLSIFVLFATVFVPAFASASKAYEINRFGHDPEYQAHLIDKYNDRSEQLVSVVKHQNPVQSSSFKKSKKSVVQSPIVKDESSVVVNTDKSEEKALLKDGFLGAYVEPAFQKIVADEKTDNDLFLEELSELPFIGNITNGCIKKCIIAGGVSMVGAGAVSLLASSTGLNDGINNYFENSGDWKHSLALSVATGFLAVPFSGYKNLSSNIAKKFNKFWTFGKIASNIPSISNKLPEGVLAAYNSNVGKVVSSPFRLSYWAFKEFVAKGLVNSIMTGIVKTVPGMP